MSSHLSENLSSNALLRALFQQDLARLIDDDDLSTSSAFLRLCIEYLGFDRDLGVVADGPHDQGIDYIEAKGSGVSIIQAKSFDFDKAVDFGKTIGWSHATDLPRIRSLFEHLDSPQLNVNVSLRRAIADLRHSLRVHAESGKPDPFHVTVYFCALADRFTEAGRAEFDRLDVVPIPYGDTAIAISYSPVFLPDLLDEKWRQTNNRWRNQKNQKRERFALSICGAVIRDSSKSFVFFTKAAELVSIYREIGYQLFEPNVRCEIKNSSVNKAIAGSIRSRRGREEFKHLNNGITIVCEGVQYVGPKAKPDAVRMVRPGVINGLQTIKTLADSALENLSKDEFAHFSEECQILTRLHTQNAVNDYRDLVKSTNNQNPMKPRNLRSNDVEQILLERYFAETLGWFYERKEGAWNAFKADPSRWSTIHRKPQHFQTRLQTRRIVRRVDNESVAQAWLAFIGFSEQAVDQKRYLFSENHSFYDLVFLNRTARHGRHYRHRIAGSPLLEEATAESPTGEGMLVAHLVWEFARNVVQTRKENREEAVSRLGIGDLDRPTQEGRLAQDTEYLRGLVLRSMLLLFVEFFGYTMFVAFGASVHEKLRALLKNGTLREIADTGDLSIAKKRIADNYEANDVLIHIWELYRHCVSQMIAGAWMRERQQAANISKFMYSEKTREPLYVELSEAGRIFKDRMLFRKWTMPLNEKGSVEEYLRAAVESQ